MLVPGWWWGTGRPVRPAVEHEGAQVLDESSACAPGLPSPAQSSVLKAQRLCWDQVHIHCPEVALGLGLCRVLGHLPEAPVRGKVVADGVLPAFVVVSEEGEQLQPAERCCLNYQSDHGQVGVGGLIMTPVSLLPPLGGRLCLWRPLMRGVARPHARKVALCGNLTYQGALGRQSLSHIFIIMDYFAT